MERLKKQVTEEKEPAQKPSSQNIKGIYEIMPTANTYKLRKRIIKSAEHKFKGNISEKEYNRYTKLDTLNL